MKSDRLKQILLAATIGVFAFIGLGAWALASPVGSAPDDDFHLASIWCSLGDREGLCAPGESEQERVVSERLIYSSGCYAYHPDRSAQCPILDEPVVNTARGNFAGNYPPLFYAVMGVFASPDVAVSTVIMRLFNAAVLVGAVAAILALLRPGQRGPLIWSAVATLVPLGVFIVPSVNPSSWAVLAGLTVWLAVYGYFTAEARGRRIALGALALLLGVMGAGARGDSAVYVAFAGAVAMILSFERTRAWLKLAWLPIVLAAVSAAFFLSANQATGAAGVGVAAGVTDAEASVALDAAASDVAATSGSRLNDLLANIVYLPWLWSGGTGTWDLGWIDSPVPPSAWIGMLGVLVTLVMWGLRIMTVRKGLVMAAAALALTVIPLYVLYGMGMRVGQEVQPRYILPLVIIFVGAALFGFAKDHLGLSRLQGGVILAIVAVANSLSMHNVMRRYISGLGEGSGFNLNTNIEWWWSMPLSPMVVWFVGSAAFALTLAGLFLILYPKGERPSAPLEERAALPSRAA